MIILNSITVTRFGVTSSPVLCVCGLWEGARAPEWDPCSHGEDTERYCSDGRDSGHFSNYFNVK